MVVLGGGRLFFMSEAVLYWVCPCMNFLERMTHARDCEERQDLRTPKLISHRSVFKRVLQESTHPPIRQLIIYYYLYKEYVDGSARKFNFCKTTL